MKSDFIPKGQFLREFMTTHKIKLFIIVCEIRFYPKGIISLKIYDCV